MRRKILLFTGLIVACASAFLFYRHWSNSRPIDRIVVVKSAHTLSTFRGSHELKTYRVALGRSPIGAKEEEGDMKTPEGVYQVDQRKPDSDYHLALHISYPSAEDSNRAAQRGVSAGSDIEIHGLPNGHGATEYHPGTDWTSGCIAVTDTEIEELWRVTPVGTAVEIRP